MTFIFPEDDHDYYADEVGLSLAGLFVRENNGMPRTGFLAVRPEVTAVTGAWRIRVGLFTYLHQISGSIQLSGKQSAEEVDITPGDGIPAGQARIDRVVYNPLTQDLSVVTGAPATSPTVPSAGGLVPMTRARINAGDGGIIQAQLTDEFQMTGFASSQGVWKQATSSGTTPVDRVALRNGWQNNINVNWQGLQTRHTTGGLEITGAVVKTGAFASQEVVGLLPPHMRPAVSVFLPAAYATDGRYVLVRPNGEIVTVTSGSGGQIALGGVIAVEL